MYGNICRYAVEIEHSRLVEAGWLAWRRLNVMREELLGHYTPALAGTDFEGVVEGGEGVEDGGELVEGDASTPLLFTKSLRSLADTCTSGCNSGCLPLLVSLGEPGSAWGVLPTDFASAIARALDKHGFLGLATASMRVNVLLDAVEGCDLLHALADPDFPAAVAANHAAKRS